MITYAYSFMHIHFFLMNLNLTFKVFVASLYTVCLSVCLPSHVAIYLSIWLASVLEVPKTILGFDDSLGGLVALSNSCIHGYDLLQ